MCRTPISHKSAMMCQKVFEFCAVGNLLLMTMLQVVCQVVLLLLKLPMFPTDWYARAGNFAFYIFTSLAIWWCERVMNVKVVITAEDVKVLRDAVGSDVSGKLQLIVANHIAYADWFAMFFLSFHLGGYNGLLRWIVKEGALKIPIAGWLMRLRNFIGLKRSFKDDFKPLQKGIEFYLKNSIDTWLTIYPEGTFVDGTAGCEEKIEQAKKFCNDKGIDEYKYSLVPRWRGLSTIIDTLQSNAVTGQVKVLDLTMAFVGRGCNSTSHCLLSNAKYLDHLT